jgi:hypothetical protein
VLSGWDRLVFRGTLRMLAFAGGMAAYLSRFLPMIFQAAKPTAFQWLNC